MKKPEELLNESELIDKASELFNDLSKDPSYVMSGEIALKPTRLTNGRKCQIKIIIQLNEREFE